MNCCHEGLEREFNQRSAAQKLAAYRRAGPDPSSQVLIDALVARNVRDATLLDIGGGVGTIQHALLGAGARASVGVDASRAYVDTATTESARRGYASRTHNMHGDFIALADSLAPAEIVTLDRVICCYPDMPELVRLSVAKAGRLYGLVVPRPLWWVQFARRAINGKARLERSPFRFFVHSIEQITAITRANGFAPVFAATSGVWQVCLYERQVNPPATTATG
ncbi:MAG: hypothetical protein H7Z42_19435 [Roseiflexaceae bacterium]|nr:hypothetical protein [Roseiflexaceae bacterium]